MNGRLYKQIFIISLVLSGIGVSAFFFAKPQNEVAKCSICGIEKAADEEGVSTEQDFKRSLQSGLQARIDAEVRTTIGAGIFSEMGVGAEEQQVTNTYKKILPANLERRQRANLYRAVACAYERLYCESEVLTPYQKQQKFEQLIKEYERKIDRLLDGDELETDPVSHLPTEPTPPDPKATPPEKPTGVPRVETPTRVSSPAVTRRLEQEEVAMYISGTRNYDVAIINFQEALPEVTNAILNRLNMLGLNADRSVFTDGFYTAFAHSLKNKNWSFLPTAGIGDRVHCLCTVTGKLGTTTSTVRGREIATVSGPVSINLIDARSGQLLGNETISVHGAGPSANPTLATTNYLNKLIDNAHFRALPFILCQ